MEERNSSSMASRPDDRGWRFLPPSPTRIAAPVSSPRPWPTRRGGSAALSQTGRLRRRAGDFGERILWSMPAALIAVFVMSGGKLGWSEILVAWRRIRVCSAFVLLLHPFFSIGRCMSGWCRERFKFRPAHFSGPLVAVAVGTLFFGERITLAQAGGVGARHRRSRRARIGAGRRALGRAGHLRELLMYAVIRKRAAVPAATGLDA